MKKAVFIDKDGTLIRNIPFNTNPRKSELLTGVAETLQLLQQDYLLFVITNQPGIALGLVNEAALQWQYIQLTATLRRLHVTLNGLYYCPHHPYGVGSYAMGCQCRKPAPGMLLQAAAQWGLRLKDCWMIGDILHDVEAGNRAGCHTILLNQGSETEWCRGRFRTPEHVCHNWNQIAQIICKK